MSINIENDMYREYINNMYTVTICMTLQYRRSSDLIFVQRRSHCSVPRDASSLHDQRDVSSLHDSLYTAPRAGPVCESCSMLNTLPLTVTDRFGFAPVETVSCC
jgi:hypothetical protein